MINLIKLQRSIFQPGVLLGINDTCVASFDGCGGLAHQQTAINVYRLLADNGAALDWHGCEGYGSNTPPDGGNIYAEIAAAIQFVGSQLVTTKGTGAPNTMAFTEFTPLNGVNDTQIHAWQTLLNTFINSPYVFGVTGPWGNSSGVRRSGAFNSGDWFFDDTNNGGTDPSGAPTFNGHVDATLTWLQGWVPSNVHP